jgi:hypothetical protein
VQRIATARHPCSSGKATIPVPAVATISAAAPTIAVATPNTPVPPGPGISTIPLPDRAVTSATISGAAVEMPTRAGC